MPEPGPMIRALVDESPAMSAADLQEWGNGKVTQIRRAAIEAVRVSMGESRFLERGLSITPAMLRMWLYEARRARESWAQVEALTAELLHEVEKTRNDHA